MANPFVHIELQTNDVAKAKQFYRSLFDWRLEDVPMGGMGTYTICAWVKGPAVGS